MLKSFCGALLAFVLALGLSQDAGAKPFVVGGGQTIEFGVSGSNGYRLHVATYGDMVSVTASGGIRRGVASYTVRSRDHGEHGFEAKLPGLGRIAVEFHPRRVVRAPVLKPCTGKRGSREFGVFRGTINFHGERDYTDVTATSAKGVVYSSYRQTCDFGEEGGGKRSEEPFTATVLTAAAPKDGVFFTANRFELLGELAKETDLPSMLTYIAGQASRHHGMRILRYVFGKGPEKSFTAEHTGRTASARVEPGSPFSGTAEFGVEPDGSVDWTGDLSVALPGTGPVHLAGEGFKAQLCVRDRCAGDNLQTGRTWSIAVTTVGRRALSLAPSSAAPTPRLWPR